MSDPVSPFDLDTPTVVLDLDRVDRNIARMAAAAGAGGVALRPHAKTHKQPAIAHRQIAAGAVGLTVAKLGEAEVFADAGIDDMVVAYPLWGEPKWQRLCDLAERVTVAVALDSPEAVEGLGRVAAARGLTIAVRVEVDTGYARCGVSGTPAVLDLARRITQTDGVEFAGVESFAGQVHAAGPASVERVARDEALSLVTVAEELVAAGFPCATVSVGGTSTASAAALVPGVTEIRPGTYVFSDRDQAAMGWGTLEDCALTVVATVVSHPVPTRAVIDAGTKTLSGDRAMHSPGFGHVIGRPDLRIDRLSEEHGVIELEPGTPLAIGDVLRIIPNHACACLNLHDEIALSQGGEIIGRSQIEARAKVR